MDRTIADLRKDYQRAQLSESEVTENPFDQFTLWFEQARNSEVSEPNAMTLATSIDNKPSARIVLLKGFDERGFVFYTNYQSRKGAEMASNPNAALSFFWAELERQVRIEGIIEKVTAEESDSYFQSRPKGSRLGAWASPQSQTIADRSVLEKRGEELQTQYENEEYVPRPEHWGGYRLIANYIEFWQGRSNRLHDRILYQRDVEGIWQISRLAP